MLRQIALAPERLRSLTRFPIKPKRIGGAGE
jgi:hypothetical protein